MQSDDASRMSRCRSRALLEKTHAAQAVIITGIVELPVETEFWSELALAFLPRLALPSFARPVAVEFARPYGGVCRDVSSAPSTRAHVATMRHARRQNTAFIFRDSHSGQSHRVTFLTVSNGDVDDVEIVLFRTSRVILQCNVRALCEPPPNSGSSSR